MGTVDSNVGSGAGLRVVVVGAGIAGLAVAISLRRQGHSVEIYERSRFKTEIGAGIVLSTNVTRLLNVFGMKEGNLFPVERIINKVYAHDRVGDPVITFPPVQAPGSKEYPTYLVHRVDLHNELKRLAISEGPGEPCKLFLGSHIIDCDPKNTSITLSTGETLRIDLVVIAEGVKSILRSRVCPSALEPKTSGYYVHRFTIPMDDTFVNDPALLWITGEMNRVTLVYDRGTKRMVVYPVRSCKVLNVVAACHISDAPYLSVIDTSYDSIVSKEDVLEAFSDFHERYIYLFKLAQPGSIRAWPLLGIPPILTWVEGNTVLVGDAAHPMWPHAAQGGAQGLEDAAALGELLPRGVPPTEVNVRLQLFEELRRPRCTTMQLYSYSVAEYSPISRGAETTADHFTMARTYDAVLAAREALAGQAEMQT